MTAGSDDYVARLRGCGYEPRFLDDGTPCSVIERGAATAPVFVASIPKAGTYLAAELLSALGVRSARLHVDDGWASDFRDYRDGTPMWKYQFEMPVADALGLVQPGQFAVGHLPCTPAVVRALDGFSRVFIFRELRHAFVSWARFVIAERMDGDAAEAARTIADGPGRVRWVLGRRSSGWLVPTCREMVGWRQEPGVLPLRYEDLAGSHGGAAQADTVAGLAKHLGLPADPSSLRDATQRSVGAKTLTWSGTPSTLATHWDAELEAWFRDVGGPDLNRALGYVED